MRGEKIMANRKLMLEGRLDANEFLNRIVYQQSSDDFGMLDVSLVNVVVEENENEDCIDDNIRLTPSPTPSTSSSFSSSSISSSTGSSQSVGQCALCDGEPELLLLPCFDFCVCKTCWNIVESNNKKLSCPSCKSIVTQAKSVNFYQQ